MRGLALATIAFAGLLAGCNRGAPLPGDVLGDVGKAFAAVQAAVAADDADALWDLLSPDGQDELQRQAERFRTDFAKATEEERQRQVAATGLDREHLAKLDGKGLLRSRTFKEKNTAELPQAKLTEVNVTNNDRATVTYKEADGDVKKMPFKKHDGRWKAAGFTPD
jgi:hypothetical protein